MSTSDNKGATLRCDAATKARIVALATAEHRDLTKQLDVIVDAGLRALGHEGLWDEPRGHKGVAR